MKRLNLFLSAILLLLIGLTTGVLVMIMLGGEPFQRPSEVVVTEVKRSMTPIEASEFISEIPVFSIRDVARMVVPTVVYIETSVSSARRPVAEDEGQNFWDRILPRGRSSSIGSGVIITPDGYILTNNHVISGGNQVRVTLHDKREYDAVVVGRDPSTDLAVIKINGSNLPHIILGNSDHLEVGEWVMAVGNPLRLRSTITAGIVSALSRDVQVINDRMRIENFIQTDAAINRGNSGGALVNIAGELVGINTAIATESGAYQGYGFAIPVNMAFKIAEDLMMFGKVQRAYLGVQIESVNQRRAGELRLPEITGVEIVGLVRGGAAETSGLRRNDVVLKVGNVPVGEANELQAQIAMFRPGEKVTLRVWRNGREFDLDVTLIGLENEDVFDWANRDPWDIPDAESGIKLQQFRNGFTAGELARPEDPYQNDIVVMRLERDSKAEASGLKLDDIILSVNGVLVQTLTQLQSGLEEGAGEGDIVLEILRDGELTEIKFESY